MEEQQTFWAAITAPPILASAAVGFLAGMLGGWLSHRWALSRDKRKEYNEAIKPARKWLKTESFNYGDLANTLMALDKADGLEYLMNPVQRFRFRHANAQGRELLAAAKRLRDSYGEEHLRGNEEAVSRFAEKMLGILKLR
jgi:hypothetical protein